MKGIIIAAIICVGLIATAATYGNAASPEQLKQHLVDRGALRRV